MEENRPQVSIEDYESGEENVREQSPQSHSSTMKILRRHYPANAIKMQENLPQVSIEGYESGEENVREQSPQSHATIKRNRRHYPANAFKMDKNRPQVSIEGYESSEENVREQSPQSQASTIKKNQRQRFSSLWNKFTIVNDAKGIAACDICGVKLSFKSSVTNLKKHFVRKHNYDPLARTYKPNLCKEQQKAAKQYKSTVDHGSLSEFIQNAGIVGEEVDLINEDESDSPQVHVVEESVVFRPDGGNHDYCVIENPQSQPKPQGNKSQYNRRRPIKETHEVKKSRMLDLQLECLEMKKYTMQMEALVLEQQLNLPRSVYTESLRDVDVYTRGTQTDVGGDTKVFYVSDKVGDSQGAHLFQFRGRLFE